MDKVYAIFLHGLIVKVIPVKHKYNKKFGRFEED